MQRIESKLEVSWGELEMVERLKQMCLKFFQQKLEKIDKINKQGP